MSTVLTELRDEVKGRLNVASGGGEPSDADVLIWVEDAVKGILAILPPVFEDTAALGTDLSLTVTDSKRILYVQTPRSILFNSEWMRDADLPGFRVLGYSTALGGESLTYWYTKNHNNASELGAGAPNVETSCMFGVDWLHELFVSASLIEVLRNMSKRHGSAGGTVFGALFRVEQDLYNERFQKLEGVWNGWNEEMRGAQQERSVYAPPIRRNPLAGKLRLRSRRVNKLTGRP